ncbi:MAG: lipopolysaccharide biosynthesis protein [Betaproteobacteria bacterium]|nr:lipopolysaccharide biosynthesis protein [Betaproteobacteria bacterium]
MPEQQKDFAAYLAVFRRRKPQIFAVSGMLLALTVAIALLWPPTYRSSATILIEEQQIPPDLVRSTVTSFATQRIQEISQRVMTRANLMAIIRKYNLYARQRRTQTTGEVLHRMRKDIHLHLINANVVDPQSLQPVKATIAFTLSYDGQTPSDAQRVDNELVSLFLSDNLKSRERDASRTTAFLATQARRLGAHISKIEAKLAAFKAAHMGSLPELTQLNYEMRDRTDTELMDVEQRINGLQQQKFYLDSQLAQINPDLPIVTKSGERVLGPADQLKALETEYATEAAIYAPDYPGVVKLRREIVALKKDVGVGESAANEAKELMRLETDLAKARQKYSDDYPEIIRLKKSIAALRALQQSTQNAPAMPEATPENPAYLALAAQRDGVETRLKAALALRTQLQSRMTSLETRIEDTPQVEREYEDLSRDHDNSLLEYQKIKNKELSARIAQTLEQNSEGERFSLIDPPEYPQKPHSPNRLAICLLGTVLSIGAGLGYAGVLESIDRSVRGSQVLAMVARAPVLSVVPYALNDEDLMRGRRARRALMVSGITGLVALLVVVQFLVMPLDVLWFSALRHVGAFMP